MGQHTMSHFLLSSKLLRLIGQPNRLPNNDDGKKILQPAENKSMESTNESDSTSSYPHDMMISTLHR